MGRRKGFFAAWAQATREAEAAGRRRQREAAAKLRHAYRMEATRRLIDAEALRAEARAAAQARRDAERQAAEEEAEGYRAQIDLLLSAHRACSAPIDWLRRLETPAPTQSPTDPRKLRQAEDAACRYQPGFLIRLLRLEEWRRTRLRRKADAERLAFDQAVRTAEAAHAAALREWDDNRAFSSQVLSGDLAAYDEVIAETDCLAELQELGCALSIAFLSPTVARVVIRAQERDVVPPEEKSVNARGQLTSKKLPAARISEIYQDFVCGGALRAARELLAVLPLQGVLVDVWTQLLSKRSGHFEDAAILSVYCPREKMERVNFGTVDASDLVSSLHHEMAFSKTRGLAAITPLPAPPQEESAAG